MFGFKRRVKEQLERARRSDVKPPDRHDFANFESRAEAFVAALPDFGDRLDARSNGSGPSEGPAQQTP
jgi:hypothetical protein